MNKRIELLNQIVPLMPEQSKTNVRIPFHVAVPLREMEIEYSYEPKELPDKEAALRLIEDGMDRYAGKEFRDSYDPAEHYLPVVNLVTLSLDAPDGYRGCAHRHAQKQLHRLTEQEASPGFLPGPLCAGEWEAVINVHAVVTAPCTVTLRITGEEAVK